MRRVQAPLTAEIPAATIAYLGASGLDEIFDQLAQVGAAGSVERVLGRELGSVGRRTLLRAVEPLLGREAALVVSPGIAPGDQPGRREHLPGGGGDVVIALQPLLAELLKAPSGRPRSRRSYRAASPAWRPSPCRCRPRWS